MLIVKTGLNYSWNFYARMVWEMFSADVFILSRLQELLITSCLDWQVPSFSRASISPPVNKEGSSSQLENVLGFVILQVPQPEIP